MTTAPLLSRVTRPLSEVARLSKSPEDVDQLLSVALDALSEAVPYDLAAVLELVGEHLEVRCARGPLATEAVRRHRFVVKPGSTVGQALHSGKARVMEAHEHEAGQDPYHGVVELKDGHGCLVVPLVAANEALGVITFDRSSCGVYPQETVELATVYGQLVALALVASRHAERLRQEKLRLQEQNRILSADAEAGEAARMLRSSRSPLMVRAIDLARQVAVTHAPVLLSGETGSGKEIFARAIHEWSDRSEQDFVKLNCAALPENLIESELFGHVRGAFSGADADRPGRFVVADGGTLLLDEVGDMPLAAQSKLLRVLQEGTFEPVGSDRTVEVDVRVIAATHVDLQRAIEQGCFREDLFYRLSLFPIVVPPLRERGDDVLDVASSFLVQHARRTGRGPWTLSDSAKAQIRGHSWPGNVRELVNVLERATILTPVGAIDLDISPRRIGSSSPIAPSLEGSQWPTLAEFETRYLEQTLERTRGKVYGPGGAAELAGMKPTTLQSRLRKRGVERKASAP